MATAKITSGRKMATRARRLQAGLTDAFVSDAGAIRAKASSRLTSVLQGSAAKVRVDRPVKVKPLLLGYSEAFARSRKAGHPVSFRVEVNPDGAATVTPVDEAETFQVKDEDKPDPELHCALIRARERGRIRAAEILANSDMLNAETFAERLGTSRMTINTKRQNGQVLGLAGAKRGFRFPVWQLDANGNPFPEMPLLHERLGGAWAVYRFLVQPHGELNGLTGREALERGHRQEVVEAAESIGRGSFS